MASDLSPSPAIARTVPSPNVSCDTRCPTSRTIAEDFLPVARGGAVVATRDLRIAELPEDDLERVSFS